MNLGSIAAFIMREGVSFYRHTGKIYETKWNKFYPLSPSVSKTGFSLNRNKLRLKHLGDSGYFTPLYSTKFQNDVSYYRCIILELIKHKIKCKTTI